MSDTAQRSLEHWSEDKRAGMDAFYALATADYRHLAEAIDWKAWLEARQAAAGERSLRLLDVACGSGKFPAALVAHGRVGEAAIEPIRTGLLDPSAFSVAEARAALRSPFVPDTGYETTLEDFDVPAERFDIVWATHALYALPPAALEEGLKRFLRAMEGGVGFIAHACRDAHYLHFYRLFLEAFRNGQGAPYLAGEDVLAGLESLGARVQTQEIVYENGAPDEAAGPIEGFLQRCVFDDTVSLDALLQNAVTGDYLASCRSGSAWRFRQRVLLMFIEG
ncbi:MAG: class I SAM-dependent methyltransferase [Alphaproteobacteria bacterium]